MNPAPGIKPLLPWLKTKLPDMVEVLESFVRAESPSTDKLSAEACALLIAATWRNRGVNVESLDQPNRGPHLRFTWSPAAAKSHGQYLVLGHYDTVYAAGTLSGMPFRKSAGRVYGPGVFDMKAGIVQALFALDALQYHSLQPAKKIVFLFTSDEEIGSESSRKLLESEARRSDAVFVLEPAFGPKGLLKTARKGVGEAQIIVHGRSSHAGLAPEKGVNAIHELALQIERITKWNDLPRGISVNAGVIEGGTRTNVIPDRARAVLDLRALHQTDMRKIDARLRKLRPILRGAKLEVHGGFTRPPLERKHSVALFRRASQLAKQMGFSIGEVTAGGGSDGNLTAALGVPTLDGLGAVGDGAHARDEHILADAMSQRSALLAALLLQ